MAFVKLIMTLCH